MDCNNDDQVFNANIKHDIESFIEIDFIKEEIKPFDMGSPNENTGQSFDFKLKLEEEFQEIDVVKEEIEFVESSICLNDHDNGSEIVKTESSPCDQTQSDMNDYELYLRRISESKFPLVVVRRLRLDEVLLISKEGSNYKNLSNDAFTGVAQMHCLRFHRSIRMGKKTFYCDTCKKNITWGCDFNRHLRIHKGEKPFACDICKKSFAQKHNLIVHLRIHTGKKPFSCDICTESFARNEHLKSHLRIHTGEKPFSCNICKKRFTRRNTLKEHIRIHTGEKPFSCEICERSFTQHSHLNVHQTIHSG